MRLRAALISVAMLAGLWITPAGATDSSCAWPGQLDSTAFNVAYPDQFAHYWVTALPAVPGASLEIRGTFPWARYMSFITYTERLEGIESLHDSQIVPDPGSANPFLPGAERYGSSPRAYTVRVVFGREDPTRPNTVYTSSADGTKVARSFIVAYRVFRADKTFAEADPPDRTGGAGLADVTMVLPSGSRVDIPRCDIPGPPPNDLNSQVAGTSIPGPGSPLGGGFDPPVWHKFYNLPDSVLTATENPRTGAALSEPLREYARMAPKGGFLDNPDNNYIFSFVNHFSFGPLVVIKGKLPTTPETYDNAATMGSGQLRYWSLCTNHAPTQRYYACLADDEVITDAEGNYKIVVSTSTNRPPGADNVHINWLPGGPTNDKVLILRNMLPDGFPNAIQSAGYTPESVRTTMGAYYPTACYSDVATFEATGSCKPPTTLAQASSARIHDEMECCNLHLGRSRWTSFR
jgi:hypothetical protein